MNTLLVITKFKISLAASFSAAIGFILAADGAAPNIMLTVTGVFFLACGASALNQYQDKTIDALMDRTKHRPLPSGIVQPFDALLVSLSLIVSGLSILLCLPNSMPSVLGGLAVVWYNAVYTYLKRKSSFAVIPGALIGSLPPVIGWTSAGGRLSNPQIIAVALFFFIWQVPHFSLYLLGYADDYKKSGIPTIAVIFTPGQLKRIAFIWLIAASIAGLLLPFFYAASTFPGGICLFSATLWFVSTSIILLKTEGRELPFILAFKKINFYALIVMSALALDKF